MHKRMHTIVNESKMKKIRLYQINVCKDAHALVQNALLIGSSLIPITTESHGFDGQAAGRRRLKPMLEVSTVAAGVMDQPELSKPALS